MTTTAMNEAKKIFEADGYKAMHEYLTGLCRAGKIDASTALEIEIDITNYWQH